MSDRSDRPFLPGVTLVAVTSVALEATVKALECSIGKADFAKVLLLSDKPPEMADPAIEWRKIDRLGSRADYSNFMLRDLWKHVETDHALCVQWDGFVLNGGAWDGAFLDYDYIGAVWPQFSDSYCVGNGGFSLRSQRLLKACALLPEESEEAEDVIISRLFRPQLEAQGIRFAPENVARRFSYERTRTTGKEFGFHGAFNLVKHLPSGEAVDLFRSLEPNMLAKSEQLELLRWALVRGRVQLAGTMLKRLI